MPLHYKIYLLSLCETLDGLISEDEQKFRAIEANFKSRLRALEAETPSAETLFLQAELNLQLGFNFLNLGQELNAVWAIRNAYNLASKCQKLFPQFVPIKKTSGVIQVMVGAVPDKYHFFMSLLGMRGSVAVGQRQLEELQRSASSLHREADVLYYTIKGLINQQVDEAARGFRASLQQEPHNRLLLFLSVNMLMKNSQSDEALKQIELLDQLNEGMPMHYLEYLRGEIKLQKGLYAEAILAYQRFIQNYKSQNFKKDSYYKIALAYYLDGKDPLAHLNFEKAKVTGRSIAEPDRHADAQLKENNFPNSKILKVRLYTDGGYYREAEEYLDTITPVDLSNQKDITEYYYRKARLADKTHQPKAAKLFYSQTIDLAGDSPWYFAANSALQLGYLARQQHDYALARQYFQKALSYKKHEYKNSIDGKAKSALDEIDRIEKSGNRQGR